MRSKFFPKSHPLQQRLMQRILPVLMLLALSACAAAKVAIPPAEEEAVWEPAEPVNTPQATTTSGTSTPAPKPEETITPQPQPIIVQEVFPVKPTPTPATAQPEPILSSASYYAKRFKGRRTASGERYDPELMTAATRDFPLQSWLKVINPVNGREVIVRVNDRTGKRKTPLIDLSRAAAKELGFLGKGKIRVHVIPLPSPHTHPLALNKETGPPAASSLRPRADD